MTAGSSVAKPISVAIIGTGFGGQSAAIQLLKRGQQDFVMLERRSFMGGTWCQNSYPGAQVDVQSPLYSLASEPYVWSQMFAKQPELAAYTEQVIEKYQLRDKTQLESQVTELRWLAEQQCWQLSIANKPAVYARSVICAQGPLSNAVIPDFKGRERFRGVSFHTNQWRHDVPYQGKRVAVIGSGASAAQVIPSIANEVAQLHVFQRSPHWVMPRPDRVFGPIARRLLATKLGYQTLRKAIYWGLEWRVLAFKYSHSLIKFFAQRKALKHLRSQVQDAELRAKLTPDYTIGCKRIIVSNTLYPALQLPQVSLHDKHDAIAEINERGIVTQQGQQIDLDMIVYSTGFDATDGAIGFEIIGRDGLSLQQAWQPFPHAYLGTCLPQFPNLYLVTGPNTGIGHTSAIFVIESQLKYIMSCLDHLRQQQATAIEVKADAEQHYTSMIHHEMKKTVWHSGGCNSWYKSKSGHVIAMFPGFSFTFRWMASHFKPQHHQLLYSATTSELSS
ncbi:MAG: NAD(P)/FAD-dependent oxidoreductase [Pseudidiomarina maritima]|nr:NAD(P)/FAD-dependent oxidoreductase [Pseudidiomarina maritima]